MKIKVFGKTVREVIGMKKNGIRKGSILITVFSVWISLPMNWIEASPYKNQQEENIMHVLRYQQSTTDESFRKGYKVAKHSLDRALQQKTDEDKAIILDLDETVLNNRPFLARLAQKKNSFNDKEWDAWVNQANAKPLPGASEFLQYADMKGIQIFYVSNRKKHLYEATEKNLKRAGLPQTDQGHLILLTDEVKTESRRKAIEKNHIVILNLGDNLINYSK